MRRDAGVPSYAKDIFISAGSQRALMVELSLLLYHHYSLYTYHSEVILEAYGCLFYWRIILAIISISYSNIVLTKNLSSLSSVNIRWLATSVLLYDLMWFSTTALIFYSPHLHTREGQNIKSTFECNALQYNTTTHYDLNNKHKIELLPFWQYQQKLKNDSKRAVVLDHIRLYRCT